MQKVAKELLPEAPRFQGDILQPQETILSITLPNITRLVRHRQAKLLAELASMMAHERDNVYGAWMHRHSDLIQACARAFGERICWEAFMESLDKVTSPSAK